MQRLRKENIAVVVYDIRYLGSDHKRSIIVVEVSLAAAVDVLTRNVISLFVMLDEMYFLVSFTLYFNV